MSNPSKQKGDRFEREIVHLLQEHGIAAEKVPLSGAVKGGSFEADINCPVRGVDRKLEAKRRRDRWKTVYGFLGSNYGLVIRDNNMPALICIRLSDFAELAKGDAGTLIAPTTEGA